MANLTVPVVITGIEFVKSTLQRFMKEGEFKDGVSEEYKRGFYDFGNTVVDTLDTMDSWIPCSKGSPPCYGNYLVCSKGVVWVAEWFDHTWWGIEKPRRYTDVEAWQPLPKPWKEGAE